MTDATGHHGQYTYSLLDICHPPQTEGLGEMMKRVLHAVQLAVPIGIITRPNIAKRSSNLLDLHNLNLRETL